MNSYKIQQLNRERKNSEAHALKPEECYQEKTLWQYVDDFVEYVIAIGLSKNTITNYTSNLRRFYEFAGEIEIKDIDYQFCRGYLSELETVNMRIGAICSLRRFGTFLEEETGFNPFQHLHIPKRAQIIPNTLSEAEMTQLFDMLETPDEKVIFEILYSTGIRRSELIHLKLEDINFNEGVVRINDGKGHKDGYVPIGKKALEAVRKYGLSSVTPKKLRVIFKKYGEKLGKRIHPHLIRHTAATHLLIRGADICSVQEFLRHESLSTTQIYTHLDFNELKVARDLLDGHLPVLPKYEPKIKTPEEIKEKKKFVQSCNDIEKLDEVNPLLNAEKAGKTLGMYKQSVVYYAKAGLLTGEYTKGCGWHFRKNYLEFLNKFEPEWLIAHRKFKRRDIREMIKKTVEILRNSGKSLAPEGIDMRIHYNKQVYMLPRKLAEGLGVSVQYVYYVLLPALHKYVKIREWAGQKLLEAYKKETFGELKQFELPDDKFLTSEIIDALV